MLRDQPVHELGVGDVADGVLGRREVLENGPPPGFGDGADDREPQPGAPAAAPAPPPPPRPRSVWRPVAAIGLLVGIAAFAYGYGVSRAARSAARNA